MMINLLPCFDGELNLVR